MMHLEKTTVRQPYSLYKAVTSNVNWKKN